MAIGHRAERDSRKGISADGEVDAFSLSIRHVESGTFCVRSKSQVASVVLYRIQLWLFVRQNNEGSR